MRLIAVMLELKDGGTPSHGRITLTNRARLSRNHCHRAPHFFTSHIAGILAISASGYRIYCAASLGLLSPPHHISSVYGPGIRCDSHGLGTVGGAGSHGHMDCPSLVK